MLWVAVTYESHFRQTGRAHLRCNSVHECTAPQAVDSIGARALLEKKLQQISVGYVSSSDQAAVEEALKVGGRATFHTLYQGVGNVRVAI